jgi:hypothetical protein
LEGEQYEDFAGVEYGLQQHDWRVPERIELRPGFEQLQGVFRGSFA